MDRPSETAQASAGPSRVEEVSQLVQKLCVANSNIGVYGLEHPTAQGAVRDAFDWLAAMIRRRGAPVVIDITEDKAFFEGLPVETRNPRVSALFNRLAVLHVHNIRFQPGITIEEYTAFHEVLSLKEADIQKAGGVKALLQKAKIKHLTMTDATYVMVREDERVVGKDAKVLDSKLTGADADRELIEYMLRGALQEAKGKDWFVNKVKNDPKGMAALITRGVQEAVSQAGEGGQKAREESIQSLVDNIRLAAGSLADPQTGDVREGQEDLKDAVLELETEIRTRSRQLMSSDSTRRFIREILSVVTSFSDQIRAGRVAEEFLKGETSLKKSEELLKRVTPAGEAPDQMVDRLRDTMRKKGVKEQDIETLRKAAAPRARRPRRRRPPDELLRDGIVQRVRRLGLEESKHHDAIDRLTVFFENKLKERAREFSDENLRLVESISRRDDAIDEIADCGVVIWDADGRVEHVKSPPGKDFPFSTDTVIRPKILADMGRESFPLTPLNDDEVERRGWSPAEYRFLALVSHVIRAQDGNLIGALLGQAR